MEPCENNGTCHNNNGSYTCECMEGYQGQHCQDGECLTCVHLIFVYYTIYHMCPDT